MRTLYETLRPKHPLFACVLSLLSIVPAGCSEGAETASREVRLPAVQGQFYPAEREKLRAAVEGFLEDALAAPPERPLGLVAPHAGYVFSGQIAADAFARARGHDYDLVVILGTPHTVPRFEGVALIPRGAFRTPLGDVEIDEGAAAELLRSSAGCLEYREAHAREHSVEVQVPFVQVLFPRAKILPAIVGSPSPEVGRRFAEGLARIARDRKALIVASSDLSHYPRYEDARRADRAVLEALASMDPERFRATVDAEERRGVPGLSTCACGEAPILALLAAAKALGATRAELVSAANSGDCLVAGDPDRVVGYGAVAFY
ncbi:MAG: AmmeMemoRadiSam system protein B, partial [Planctomycetota bacterium]